MVLVVEDFRVGYYLCVIFTILTGIVLTKGTIFNFMISIFNFQISIFNFLISIFNFEQFQYLYVFLFHVSSPFRGARTEGMDGEEREGGLAVN